MEPEGTDGLEAVELGVRGLRRESLAIGRVSWGFPRNHSERFWGSPSPPFAPQEEGGKAAGPAAGA